MALSDLWKLIVGEDGDSSNAGAESPGESEEMAGQSPPEERRYLTIGVDWGTSATKVVIRDPYGPSSPAYLVDFGEHSAGGSPYLLPSALSVDANGEVRFGEEQAGIAIPELKVHLTKNPTEPLAIAFKAQPRELAALYIADVLRYARRWLLDAYGDRYRGYEFIWEFNLGIPAASHANEGIRRLFKSVARAGWGLSRQTETEVQDARTVYASLDQGQFDPGIHEDLVNVIPEVAAQVAGYARSSLRRPGLHVLVDVGASTLDLAGFMLTEQQGEDRFSILEAGVYSLGAFQLERNRLSDLKALGRDVIDSDEYSDWAGRMARRCQDPMREVPSSIRDYFPEAARDDIQRSDIKNIDEEFETNCFKTIRALIADLRKNRAPRGKRWEEGLPIFLAGGGKDVKLYRDALKEVDYWREDYLTAAPFDIRELPSLEDITAPDLDPTNEHRFSVAYGLSYPGDDIGEIKPPNKIPNINLDSANQSLDTTDYRDTKAWT